MKDSPTLHFLKHFPPWIVLTALTLIFVAFYFYTNDGSYKEWVSLILASLFTALGVRAAQAPAQSANTNSGDVIVSPEKDLSLTGGEIDSLVENIEEIKED